MAVVDKVDAPNTPVNNPGKDKLVQKMLGYKKKKKT